MSRNKLLLILAVVLQWSFGYWVLQNARLALALQAASLFLIGWYLLRVPAKHWGALLGLARPQGKPGTFAMILGAVLGLGFAMYYRYSSGDDGVIATLMPFAAMAAAIGFTEELLYRGLVYGAWRDHAPMATAISSLAHAGYKFLIFFPLLGWKYWLVGLLTLLVGLLLGYFRTRWRSLWPAILFHVVFDVWVYGDQTTPWWVM